MTPRKRKAKRQTLDARIRAARTFSEKLTLIVSGIAAGERTPGAAAVAWAWDQLRHEPPGDELAAGMRVAEQFLTEFAVVAMRNNDAAAFRRLAAAMRNPRHPGDSHKVDQARLMLLLAGRSGHPGFNRLISRNGRPNFKRLAQRLGGFKNVLAAASMAKNLRRLFKQMGLRKLQKKQVTPRAIAQGGVK